MGCLCSLLKALTSSFSSSSAQSLNPILLEKKRIAREESRKRREEDEKERNLIEKRNCEEESKKCIYHQRDLKPNIIRSSSQITSSSFPSMDEGENDEKSKRDGYKSEFNVFSTSNSKHTNSEGSSITGENFVDHNFPSRPTFVHRAPSLRHSKSTSKSISTSVDCVSSNSSECFSHSSNPVTIHSSTPTLVHTSPSTKIPMSQNKRVTFCENNERID